MAGGLKQSGEASIVEWRSGVLPPLLLVAVGAGLLLLLAWALARQRRSASGPGEPVIPLVLSSDEDGFVVRSPLLPELVTSASNREEAVANARDALIAVFELYEDLGKPLPAQLRDLTPERARFEVSFSSESPAAA